MAQLLLALILGITFCATPMPALAQRATLPPRVAVVLATSTSMASPRLAALQEGLRALGYMEGQNLALDVHPWVGADKQLSDLAAGLVQAKPAVIVAESNSAIVALKGATQTIPIVMTSVGDPVGSGFVANLSRPGGNITGLSNTAEQLSGKRLELLRDLVPQMTRVGVLRNPANATHVVLLRETEAAARSLGMTLLAFDFRNEADLENSFAAMAEASVHAVVALPQPSVIALRKPLVDSGVRRRLPMIFHSPEPVEVGGLVAYGPSPTALWRRAAYYVDRILKGTSPSDLPIEQPTHFDLVLNSKAAKQLGLVVPQSMRLRADRIIE